MKPQVFLFRRESGPQGTFGSLVVGSFSRYTGELPYLDNAANVSCVPEGDYPVQWTYSPHFGRFMYLLGGTDPRAGIRAHSANLMGNKALGYRAQLNGCIALGEKIGWMDGQKALLLSAPAVRHFETFMNHEPFVLVIRGDRNA